MAANATHIPVIIENIDVNAGNVSHTQEDNYGCVIIEDMASNATHTPADMVVVS